MAIAGLKSTAGLPARLLRRQVRRAAAALKHRRLSLQGTPVLFANSFPKSGTHLLTQVLEGFTRLGPAVVSGLPAVVTYQGDTGEERPASQILGDLRRLKPGDIAYGHLHAFPEVVDFFCRPGFAGFFMLRDPRDVVVSHVHYVTEMAPGHVHHAYYANELTNFADRLAASILGRPDWEHPFPDIRQRFEPYLGWLDHPAVLTLRYEDFLVDRQAALRSVLEHAVDRGFPLNMSFDRAVGVLEDAIDPQRSPTFRSGKAGGWQTSFTEVHRHLFKQVAGDLLVKMGYEPHENW